MAGFSSLAQRAPDRRGDLPQGPAPEHPVIALTCLDPRLDPAHFLGLGPGDAVVLRNAGGRVTPEIEEQIGFLGYLASALLREAAGPMEVAIVHHNQCGLALLADEDFNAGFARTMHKDVSDLVLRPVVDERATAVADARQLLESEALPAGWTVSAHVYDVTSGSLERLL